MGSSPTGECPAKRCGWTRSRATADRYQGMAVEQHGRDPLSATNGQVYRLEIFFEVNRVATCVRLRKPDFTRMFWTWVAAVRWEVGHTFGPRAQSEAPVQRGAQRPLALRDRTRGRAR